ncbi:3-phosphoshikimate 1-carboxyvinyltransferase [Arthrobacter sp. UM1]|uniref:3-phosphoshikimate 1-carboxyvinyltransferase n=1 Tax=Arthrobacter sp. UM1 TaxID=2766776 RepID=UPI001CF6FA8A|nr:3-phosphoshikimate 1-carboxyvinyltransferase [Arthrobacter sp. UM1]MCB4207192.1 3-phosphoshikimate 1-carboxyvinyltransferase [Arthrobacter sp. UM1]
MTRERMPLWEAPSASRPVEGTVSLPGSKSLTNRVLLLAALGDRPVTVTGALESDDSLAMRHALEQLGAGFEQTTGPEGGDALRVTPVGLGPAPAAHRVIDVNQAGTVMRFVPVVAALLPGTTDFTAHSSATQRPMGPLVAALRSAGVRVDPLGEDDDATHLPLRVTGIGTPSGELSFEVDASSSSQFLSALLLGVCAQSRPARIRHRGARIPSRLHVEMTVQTLREFGAAVEETAPDEWLVTPPLRMPETVAIEPDLSNAGPFLAAAVVTGGTVRVPNWPLSTTQIGDRWRQILPQLGASVSLEADGPDAESLTGTLTVTGGERVLPAEVDDAAELAPVLAAMLALAEGESRLTGIAHLRGHETDRIAALAAEIRLLGAEAEETEDGLVLRGTASPQAADHRSYHDHRMATAAAVWGLKAPGTRVEAIGVTAKTMPDFPAAWDALVKTAR